MNTLKFSKQILFSVSILMLASCGGGSSKDDDSGKSNTAQDKIEAFANGNKDAPTVQDYIDAGITGINAGNLKEINTVVDNLEAEDVDTKEEIQALADKLGVSLSCLATQHKENGICVSNTKAVNCNAGNIPENSTKIDAQVNIIWNNNSWSNATSCEWSCNSGYHIKADACEVDASNQLPTANAGEDQNVVEGTNIAFDASASTDDDGTITSWKWEEGSTILSTKKSFSKNDFLLGTHKIKLTILDNDGGSASDVITVVIVSNDNNNAVLENSGAAKFLNRATFGSTNESISKLVNKGSYEKWLNEQVSLPATLHFPLVKALATKMCANLDNDGNPLIDSWEVKYPRQQVWWETATMGNDQLRQRVALALSEILVISDSDGLGLSDLQFAVTSYYDVLVKHAFGNYRDLLEEVTLHPAMGDFLSMTRNQKENIEEGIRPDENYARELLQLFSIGVHELHIDGTEKLDVKGLPIATYNQKTIEEFAKVFTGWNYADAEWNDWFGKANHTKSMVAVEQYHDTSIKLLLNGEQSSASQTAQQDIDFALDNIFKHPNIAPFISKQLIKRLVTSNPSPQYVARVAEKFNNNGKGVKGDLKTVISAILLDDEALATTKPDNFGKLREPILRMTHLWRAFNMQTSLRIGHYWESDKKCGQGSYRAYNFWDSLSSFARKTGQGPLQAKSVFNFFRPDYSPNGVLNDSGLTAPEFQIINENTMVAGTNLFHELIEQFSDSKPSTPKLEEYSTFDLSHVTGLAKDTSKLLDYLSLVLLNNQMSDSLRDILSEHLDTKDVYSEGTEGQFERAREAILLITSSPEYLIQR